jgi:hypothetical protein
MIWIIISIVIYLLSAYYVWRYLHIAHSKGGRWEMINTDKEDVASVVVPILNTIIAIGLLSEDSPYKHKQSTNNKFFKIK